MALMSDQWIEKEVQENNIISPFEKKQIREGKISYGLSSYGYDARVSDEFKVFTNVNNPRSGIERKDEYLLTYVKKGASIGANATIICGNNLGEYCFIGAGSTVTKDVPDFALMVGSPAIRIGWMSKSGIRLKEDLICPLDGSKYKEVSENQLICLE